MNLRISNLKGIIWDLNPYRRYYNLIVTIYEKLQFIPPKFGAIFNSTFNVSIFAMHSPNFQIFAIQPIYPKIPILPLIYFLFFIYFYFFYKKIGVQKWLDSQRGVAMATLIFKFFFIKI
jgi:hypothetical protein